MGLKSLFLRPVYEASGGDFGEGDRGDSEGKRESIGSRPKKGW